MSKIKWGVVLDREQKFVCKGDTDKPAWTNDRAEADRIAEMTGGRVVDMEEWAKNPQFKTSRSASGHLTCGPWEIGVELGSNVGTDVTRVAIKTASFKRGGRKATGIKTLTIVVEYETAS